MGSLKKTLEKYPRLGGGKKLLNPPGQHDCDWCEGEKSKAIYSAWVQMWFMRGDDERRKLCQKCYDELASKK